MHICSACLHNSCVSQDFSRPSCLQHFKIRDTAYLSLKHYNIYCEAAKVHVNAFLSIWTYFSLNVFREFRSIRSLSSTPQARNRRTGAILTLKFAFGNNNFGHRHSQAISSSVMTSWTLKSSSLIPQDHVNSTELCLFSSGRPPVIVIGINQYGRNNSWVERGQVDWWVACPLLRLAKTMRTYTLLRVNRLYRFSVHEMVRQLYTGTRKRR